MTVLRIFVFLITFFPLYVANASFLTLNRDPLKQTKIFGVVEDQRLLSLDVMSILVSNQLRGLSDVMDDPSFWEHGGFAQPIFPIPDHSSLTTFIQRDCIITSMWLLIAIAYGDYAQDKISSRNIFFITLTFLSLRIIYELLLCIWYRDSIDLISAIKDVWFLVIIVIPIRFAYYQRYS